jgi:hypothetical protein
VYKLKTIALSGAFSCFTRRDAQTTSRRLKARSESEIDNTVTSGHSGRFWLVINSSPAGGR